MKRINSARSVATRVFALTAGISAAFAIGITPASSVEPQGAPESHARLLALVESGGLTRGQLANLYASLSGVSYQPPACVAGQERFTDVPASNPFCPWIEDLARRGITGGCTATQYCPNAAVTRAQMAVFLIKATANEALHFVGAPGEPAFGNGGDGDCLWINLPHPYSKASFFKNSDGIVHLAGSVYHLDGGGNGCGGEPDVEDHFIFELPDGYRPQGVVWFPTTNMDQFSGVGIVPADGVQDGEIFIPGGTVWVGAIGGDGYLVSLEGITFRAAPPATLSSPAREPARLSLEELHGLLH